MHPFLASIRHTIEKNGLIRPDPPGGKILVAVSGGADSVALLHGLLRIFGEETSLAAVHIHHGLRGEEADKDAAFVEEICETAGVECRVLRVDPRRWTETSGESVQMRAREMRYEFFREAIREHDANSLALGHTADDQAETVLVNLLRGTGHPGLAGIPPVRDAGVGTATIIRPLIETPREEILRFLADEGLPFREDSSNRSDKYLRNRIRRHLLPELRRYNPNIRDQLGRTAEILRAEEEWMEKETTRVLESAEISPAGGEGARGLSIPRLLELPLALRRRVINRLLKALSGPDATFGHVEALLEQLSRWSGEKRISLPGGAMAIRDRETLYLLRADGTDLPAIDGLHPDPPPAGQKLHVPGTTELPPWGILVETSIEAPRRETPAVSSTLEARLDYDLIGGALRVRSRRPGDRFRPLGLGGSKKLQDFLVDARVPRRLRERVPLLVTEDGRVVWVIGHRIDDRFKIRPKTGRVLLVRASPLEISAGAQ